MQVHRFYRFVKDFHQRQRYLLQIAVNLRFAPSSSGENIRSIREFLCRLLKLSFRKFPKSALLFLCFPFCSDPECSGRLPGWVYIVPISGRKFWPVINRMYLPSFSVVFVTGYPLTGHPRVFTCQDSRGFTAV